MSSQKRQKKIESERHGGRLILLQWQVLACSIATSTLLSSGWQGASPTTLSGSKSPPVVTAIEAPVGTEALPVKWISVAAPGLGVMRAAVARPPGEGPFPAVLILHGTHGFARQYVEWATALAQRGLVAVAACWFSGGSGAAVNEVTPVACPEIPPLGPGEYPETVHFVDALVQATRTLTGVRPDRIGLVGHSRGAGATQQYLMAGANVQAAVLHSSGYGLKPWNRAGEYNVPILIMHGTADSFGVNTRINLAREFETALRARQKSVETAYCEGCGHNTFFTDSTQRDQELKRMSAFLLSRLAAE